MGSNARRFSFSISVKHILIFLTVPDGFVNRLDWHVVILSNLLWCSGARSNSLPEEDFGAEFTPFKEKLFVARSVTE